MVWVKVGCTCCLVFHRVYLTTRYSQRDTVIHGAPPPPNVIPNTDAIGHLYNTRHPPSKGGKPLAHQQQGEEKTLTSVDFLHEKSKLDEKSKVAGWIAFDKQVRRWPGVVL